MEVRKWNYRIEEAAKHISTKTNTVVTCITTKSKYELKSDPAAKAGNMGKEKSKEMLFWTKPEYKPYTEPINELALYYRNNVHLPHEVFQAACKIVKEFNKYRFSAFLSKIHI